MAIYLVVLISTISQMGFGGSRVAVSLYALELGANQFTVGVIVALYSLSPMFFSIVIGRVSDRVSPHWPMIIGSVMMMVALLIPVASPSLVMLCVLAFLNGLGHLIFSIPLEAAVGGVGADEAVLLFGGERGRLPVGQEPAVLRPQVSGLAELRIEGRFSPAGERGRGDGTE